MINAVTPAAGTQSAGVAPPAGQKPPEAKPQNVPEVQDTVHLSSTAQAQVSAIKAAVQEASETPAQTGKEARAGDRQAQRLLAREVKSASRA